MLAWNSVDDSAEDLLPPGTIARIKKKTPPLGGVWFSAGLVSRRLVAYSTTGLLSSVRHSAEFTAASGPVR